jgi:hypothetical protein
MTARDAQHQVFEQVFGANSSGEGAASPEAVMRINDRKTRIHSILLFADGRPTISTISPTTML